jgi:hypothetical protein
MFPYTKKIWGALIFSYNFLKMNHFSKNFGENLNS